MMLLDTLLTIQGILDRRIESIQDLKTDMDRIATLISSSVAEGHAQDINILMGGDEDALEDILIGLEEELDQVRKEEIRDLLKQLKVMRKLTTSLVEAVEDLDE